MRTAEDLVDDILNCIIDAEAIDHAINWRREILEEAAKRVEKWERDGEGYENARQAIMGEHT